MNGSADVDPGWFPDSEPGWERFWNGAEWTVNRRPVFSPTPEPIAIYPRNYGVSSLTAGQTMAAGVGRAARSRGLISVIGLVAVALVALGLGSRSEGSQREILLARSVGESDAAGAVPDLASAAAESLVMEGLTTTTLVPAGPIIESTIPEPSSRPSGSSDQSTAPILALVSTSSVPLTSASTDTTVLIAAGPNGGRPGPGSTSPSRGTAPTITVVTVPGAVGTTAGSEPGDTVTSSTITTTTDGPATTSRSTTTTTTSTTTGPTSSKPTTTGPTTTDPTIGESTLKPTTTDPATDGSTTTTEPTTSGPTSGPSTTEPTTTEPTTTTGATAGGATAGG